MYTSYFKQSLFELNRKFILAITKLVNEFVLAIFDLVTYR